MLDLATLRHCRRFDHPFVFGLVDEPFRDRETALALCREFPTRGYEYCSHGTGRFVRRPLFVRGEDKPYMPEQLGSHTMALADQLASPSYRDLLAEALSADLAGTQIEAWFWRYDHATEFVPHRDQESKLVTQVFYLNESWPAEAGGQLRILNTEDPEDVALEIAPSLALSSLIRRSDTSWHLLMPVHRGAPASRNSLTVHFHRP